MGNGYVLVAEDYFLLCMHYQTALTVARCLFEDYAFVQGVPEGGPTPWFGTGSALHMMKEEMRTSALLNWEFYFLPLQKCIKS